MKENSAKLNEKQLKKKVKSKKRKKKAGVHEEVNVESDSSFSLKDVLHLGGEKEEYENLMELDENEELEINTVSGENVSLQNELQSFMKDIGLEINESQVSVKEEKVIGNIKSSDVAKKKKKIKVGAENRKDKPVEVETQVSVKEEKVIENIKSSDVTKKKKKIKVGAENRKDKPVEVETPTIEFRSLQYKKYDRMLLKDCLPWYELIKGIPKCPATLYKSEIDGLYEVAEKYWNTETEIYQEMKENERSSDAQWLRTVLKSGTLTDRVAALTMLTQESPLHCMKSLDALISMAKKKSRREALIAIDSLRHIWIADLLPDHKLRKFNELPIENLNRYTKHSGKEEQIKLLMIMIFEDQLKRVYKDYIDILQNFSKDPLPNIRSKVLSIVYELLVMKSEQEHMLLSILINKLGDQERKVASKSSFLLCELVTKHPNMKMIVVNEVERMMYRLNICEKAQYYAICFLNQIVLSHREKNIASKLISVYFSFFKTIVKKQQGKTKSKGRSKKSNYSQQTKLLSGLLTGVNRAFPYVEGLDETYDDNLNTLFRLTHVSHLRTSIQAFMFIYQVMESKQSVSDRYYQALYEKLLDPNIALSSIHNMLLNLLFKSMKNDHAFKRVKSFIKRLLQISSQNPPSFLCGLLFLISEVIKCKPGVKSMTEQPEDKDDEEHFIDAELDDDAEKGDDVSQQDSDKENDVSDVDDGEKLKESWTFVNKDKKDDKYVINHRNPLYSGAENSCLWEIIPLLSHFHPSVAHFATSVVNGEDIDYKGDPSQDFSLISFLDRFMYRNPKKKEVDHGHSLMQRKEISLRFKEEPMNSKLFLQKSEENIPQDQVFFYRYFKEKMDHKVINKTDDNVYSDGEIGDVDDIDFAGEMKQKKEMKRKKRNKGNEDDSESESEEEAVYDYDDISDESSDEAGIKRENFTDNDYENALLENLDSEGESINGDDGVDNDTVDPMFAAAEEFSHILEGGDEQSDGAHYKQLKWEESGEKHDWKNKKNSSRMNMKRKRDGSKQNKNLKKRKMRN